VPTNGFQARDGLLTVSRADEGAHVRLTLVGELDLSNAPTLEASLAAAIDSGKKVVFDLSGLEFLDSTGLALIVGMLGRSDAERFSFVPSRSRNVRRLLSLTGLDERMVIDSGPVETLSAAPPA
jgi:anti-sigma B factor antagonist